jgi:hypothetical protein
MTDERPPPGPIDPRFLDRLSDTLSSRLKDIEVSRRKARRLLTEVRDRIDHLKKIYGLPLDECRSECDRLLWRIDELGGPTFPTQEEIEILVQQVVRLSAMISMIDRARFSRKPRQSRNEEGRG